MSSPGDTSSTAQRSTTVGTVSIQHAFPSAWQVQLKGNLLELKYPRTATDADYRLFVEACASWVRDNHAPWCICIDFTDYDALRSSTAPRRKLFADSIAKHSVQLNTFCQGAGIVSQSSITRGIATAILWLLKPKFQTEVFETREAATAWCKKKLQ